MPPDATAGAARFGGRVAVVTGGSSGIGRAIALQLAREGAAVAITGRTPGKVEAAGAQIAECGTRTIARVLSATDEAGLAAFLDEVSGTLGGLDVFVSSAGIMHYGGIARGQAEQWREMLEVNVLGLLIAFREAARAMRAAGRGGTFVNISSIRAHEPHTWVAVYSATKAAANSIADTARNEFAKDGIRVLTVMPGSVATDLFQYLPPKAREAMFNRVGKQPGFPVWGEDGRLTAEGARFLATEAAAWYLPPETVARAVLDACAMPAEAHVTDVIIRPAKEFGG